MASSPGDSADGTVETHGNQSRFTHTFPAPPGAYPVQASVTDNLGPIPLDADVRDTPLSRPSTQDTGTRQCCPYRPRRWWAAL